MIRRVSEHPSHASAWLRQRRSGEAALQTIADDELRQLDDATALARSDALLSVPATVVAARRSTSGFVDQQRLFGRARR
jgi:hypothetical protein